MHRASSACEMFAIGKHDLHALFLSNPEEGKIILDSVLAEHARKQGEAASRGDDALLQAHVAWLQERSPYASVVELIGAARRLRRTRCPLAASTAGGRILGPAVCGAGGH